MTTLPDFELNYTRLIDKSIILYGASGTGKSTIIVDMLHQLQNQVEQIIVVSPTDTQNHTYDAGIVPLPCIHYTVTLPLLQSIWDRQVAMGKVYTKANQIGILRALFNKIPNKAYAEDIINQINKKHNEYSRELSLDGGDGVSTKLEKMKEECQKLTVLIYKHYISQHKDTLGRMKLTNDEAYSLKYINFNYRLILILDDCTHLIKKFKSSEIMQQLFYQGRHSGITLIFACHTDKALDAELKKNAAMSIFTDDRSARAYFSRGSSDFDKAYIREADAAIKAAFTPLAKHQKLLLTRDDNNKLYKYTASPRKGFKFGSEYIWKYCDNIKAESGDVSQGNRFMRYFT